MRIIVLLFISFGLFATVSASWAGGLSKNVPDGTVIEAVITNAGAPFRFIVRVKDYGIDKIDVYSQDKKKLQSVKFPDYAQGMPCSDCDFLEFKDLNFDSYNDMLILVGWGSGGRMYEPWIFNPKKKRFEPSNLTDVLENPTVDKDKRIVIETSPMGCCAGTIKHYKVNGNKFLLIKEEKYSPESNELKR